MLSGPRPKAIFQAHKQKSSVLIFRGDFLGLQKWCGFATYTQSTANLVLPNT